MFIRIWKVFLKTERTSSTEYNENLLNEKNKQTIKFSF